MFSDKFSTFFRLQNTTKSCILYSGVIDMKISENIRYYRERAGMYQSDLGKYLGVSAQAVSKWELGKAEPDSTSIIKMCVLFGISSDELLGREPKEDPSVQAIKEQLINLLATLSPDQVQRVEDFVSGLKASDKG
jgi:transcriptional regulator with XRE-family HTH domain